MNRRAVARLATLPFARMRVGMILVSVFGALSLLCIPFIGLAATWPVAMTLWLTGMLLGITLQTLMRIDALLLPDFTRHLAWAGLAWLLVLLALPTVLALGFGNSLQAALLMTSTWFLAINVGMAAGTGIRVAYFAWVIFPVIGLLPADLNAMLLKTVTTSPWVPVLIILLATLLLRHVLRPLITVNDRDDEDSPMQAVADGRKPAVGSTGMPQRLGFIGRKIKPILDATGQRNLARCVARFQRKPGAQARMAVIRAVLLPHDNWQGTLVNMAIMAAIGALYILLINHDGNMSVGFLASYALLLGLSRFPTVGRGMHKMQPSFADLYMTLAPQTHRHFQATLADALLKLVAVSVFNCVAYTALIAILLQAAHPAKIILTGLIVGIGASFAALAVHLVGPNDRIARNVVQVVVLIGSMLVYGGVLWMMHRFGMLVGGLAGIIVCLPVGLIAWYVSRRIYVGRRPCFDAPME